MQIKSLKKFRIKFIVNPEEGKAERVFIPEIKKVFDEINIYVDEHVGVEYQESQRGKITLLIFNLSAPINDKEWFFKLNEKILNNFNAHKKGCDFEVALFTTEILN